MEKMIFGVWRDGKLLFAFGKAVECSFAQAEIIASLLCKAAEKVLNPGDYIAYDFAKKHNVN